MDTQERGLATHIGSYWVLPIPQRLGTPSQFTGKGVTMCFIDSGFQLHPDLTQPTNRIVKTHDIHHPDQEEHPEWIKPHPHSWHGTMTSVVGAGNGTLSGGYYRSLAPDAQLVLIKVMDAQGSISGSAIQAALQWVLDHHEEYGIRIINLSVTDDQALPYRENPLGRLVEQLVEAGINVVAAAGNETQASLKAPANIPHAITVGGLNDANTLHPSGHSLYHSTFGPTADFTYKPELIAPAIWVPAPILPGTAAQREAEGLFTVQHASNRFRPNVAANLWYRFPLQSSILTQPPAQIDDAVNAYLDSSKYLSPDYQHSDGTSFAAPIVCGVIAQMLEANPQLTAAAVREMLLETARKLPNFPTSRQGFGVVHPQGAIMRADDDHHDFFHSFSPIIDYRNRRVTFRCHEEDAQRIQLAGAFNNWQPTEMQPTSEHHFWETGLPLPAVGKYPYKFVIDGQTWIPDQRNLFREPDQYGGFHSLLFVEPQD